ncbi:interferon lambda receptor 1 [Sceloporus undulatus]|uniref:interferon lambda receptor 1 n=1 Tax=Sceloporus undulatus TaxID=8520 RepID=UPI001C4D44FD|nr:interferon lambda receptor 1 [Sceloporus undulatus]
MSPFGVFIVVALLVSSKQVLGNGFLPPPQNVTVVSKGFGLFLTWLPDEHYPPGVSYTVQWKNSFVPWGDISHCRAISETICNITCASPNLNNRYWVQVKAQMRTGTGIISSIWQWKSVDYEIHVNIVPPVLQLRKTEHTLWVNATFVYPSCTKAIFQQGLTYDLKIWAEHGTEKPREFKELTKNVMDINITDWRSGNYCVRAQAFFNNNNKKRSNFSEPICTLLHENSTALQGGAQSWGFVAFPFLIMLSAGAIALFLWSKYKMKDIKMPQALDFSRFRSTKKLLEFGGRELITVYNLTCTEVPFTSEMRGRPGLQLYSILTPSAHSLSEEDDEDDEDDDDSLVPYTGMIKFQKKERNSQRIAMDQKVPDPSSGSGCSEPNGGCCLPDLMASERLFVSTEWETDVDYMSGFSENNRMSISENSSADSSLGFPAIRPTSRTEGQDANGDIDFLIQWPPMTKEPDFNFPTGLQFGDANSHPELTCKRLGNAQVTLDEINLDSFDLFHEEQLTEEESSEKDSSDCEGLFVERPLLKAPSCKEDLENVLLGGSRDAGAEVLSSSMCHGYRPKHIPYISRT